MKNTEMKERLGIEVGSAADAIREAIAGTPKMSKQDRHVVARNMDDLLKRAKRDGVPLYEVAEHAGLGSRGEKNPKHLRPYRQPAEAKDRKLNWKAQGYVNLVEALAGIPNHSSSGATDDLLRELFEGSTYGAPRGAGAELKVELKALIDGCVEWMDRQLGLAESYALLERMNRTKSLAGRQGRAAALYDASIKDKPYPYLDVSPELLLGTQYHVFQDARGEDIVALDSKGNLGRVCYGRRIYLYAGPGDDDAVRPFLVVYPTLVLRGHTFAKPDRPIDRIIDGSEFGALELQLYGDRAFIERDVVSKTVDLAAMEEAESDEEEEDNPVLHAFIDANPDFADQEFSEGEGNLGKNYEIFPLTLDVLDSLESWLEHADTSRGILANAENFPASLRYGSSGLARLADRFMQPWIFENLFPEISKLKEMKAGLDWLAPPDGWVHPLRHPHFWSATDIWWLRSKWFKIVIDNAFKVKSQGELAAYTDLMARFQENGGPTPGASQ